ncbi:MarR family transcriptional regulator [Flavobacteriaceae bacterium D16]|jgi:DNA-binding MarR family transcriptional regulator|nr:MarR family transcriptional regulator [Flavobacteriaceae bacterium D16]
MESMDVYIDFERSIGPWIGRTSKMVDYYIQEALEKHGLDLTKEQMVVLKKVNDQDGLNQNELAFLTYRDKSSLARLLAKMEKKGYLYRQQNSDDKRINEVFLTPMGRDIFQECKVVIKHIIETMERNIDESEIQQMIRVLKKVQQNFAGGLPEK